MTAWADHGREGNGEPLAIVLRPGNAGSNTAADHIDAARLAVAQLPRRLRNRVLARADSGGGTHDFLHWLTARPRRRRKTVFVLEHQEFGVLGHLTPGQHYEAVEQIAHQQVGN